MFSVVWVALYPLLLWFSIPLTVFALLTTTAAFSTLLLRVLLVYADLATILVKTLFSHPPSPESTSSLWPTKVGPNCSRRKSSASSSSDPPTFGGSRTPRSAESSGLGIYGAGSMQRDFEGVGGWREGEDALWTSMNARLELPSLAEEQHRHHRRSLTSGGTPSTMRTKALEQYSGEMPMTARSLGTTSPPEDFLSRHASKSTTVLSTVDLTRIYQ